MEDISSTEKMKIRKSTSKVEGASAVFGWILKLFSTPVIKGTISTHSNESAQNPPIITSSGTPQMSVLFKVSYNIKVGYFGKLEFLDNQVAFTEVFGDKPSILSPNIIMSHNSTSAACSLYSFR